MLRCPGESCDLRTIFLNTNTRVPLQTCTGHCHVRLLSEQRSDRCVSSCDDDDQRGCHTEVQGHEMQNV